MLLAHAVTLVQARSCIAALSDRARNLEASSAFERALIQLDCIHDDDVPALDTTDLTEDRTALAELATTAIRQLHDYGVDSLRIELLLAALEDAHALDYESDDQPDIQVDSQVDDVVDEP
ncbi:MAG: hypothetical protein QM572_11950 [Nocardioides sp.]|uniref:hypothetical protein n=1 Tax=Nocardioides sp. TaxID=35761 RepID=UPI0039E6C9F3